MILLLRLLILGPMPVFGQEALPGSAPDPTEALTLNDKAETYSLGQHLEFLEDAEKDEEGVIWSAELSSMTPEGIEEIRYGAFLGEVAGLVEEDLDPETEADEEAADEATAEVVKAVSGLQSVLGLTADDVNPLVYSLPIGHSGILALVEHVWAGHLHQATLDAGGVILGQALIEPQGLIMFGKELQAAVDAVSSIEVQGSI